MFLNVRVATSGDSRLRRKDILHFIPFVLCAMYYAPLYLQSREQKLDYIIDALQNYPPVEWRIRSLLLACQALPYIILTVLMFLAHNRKEKDSSSPIGKLHLLWLRVFIVMILTTAAAGLLRIAFNFRTESMLLVPLCFSVVVYVAGYMALKYPEALTRADEASPSKKYEKSNLTAERAEVYLKKLLQVMKTERPYVDGDLTLQKLADRLSIPVNHKAPISVSVSDLFRVQQGTRGDAFASAPRLLLAGGQPMYIAAGLEVPLSTGQTCTWRGWPECVALERRLFDRQSLPGNHGTRHLQRQAAGDDCVRFAGDQTDGLQAQGGNRDGP